MGEQTKRFFSLKGTLLLHVLVFLVENENQLAIFFFTGATFKLVKEPFKVFFVGSHHIIPPRALWELSPHLNLSLLSRRTTDCSSTLHYPPEWSRIGLVGACGDSLAVSLCLNIMLKDWILKEEANQLRKTLIIKLAYIAVI